MFCPTTPEEVRALGWSGLDVILITGDAYVDSPYMGISVIGHHLMANGFKVGIISQPDIHSDADITRLGEPRLFWGVSGGAIDSMVANTTALMKPRRQDDLTPGVENNKRPNRAVIAYCNLIRTYYKSSRPIVLGGLEASLRRVAHYDHWDNAVRRSILFDARADYLVYGMGEKATLEIAENLARGEAPLHTRGVCRIGKAEELEAPEYQDYIQLPEFETVKPATPEGKDAFTRMFGLFYRNNDPMTAKGLYQATSGRVLIQNPPQPLPGPKELEIYSGYPYERDAHPTDKAKGEIRALATIRFSITTHRGCYGECNFCAIAAHQGRTVVYRSEDSIVKEAKTVSELPGFKGIILDVGGPTANMYGFECEKKKTLGPCPEKRCVFPEVCPSLNPNHQKQMRLLSRLKAIPGVRKVFVASGIRPDLVQADKEHGTAYVETLAAHHVSGQLKLAPEHSVPSVLKRMGKPSIQSTEWMARVFDTANRKAGKRQFLTYYFIAAHPGCRMEDQNTLKAWISRQLGIEPEQVQIFTPTPSTWSSLMYYTEKDPWNGEPLFVEKTVAGKMEQKEKIGQKKGRPGYSPERPRHKKR